MELEINLNVKKIMLGFKKIIAAISLVGIFFLNVAGFVFAQEEWKIEIPYDKKYDDIEKYDYPYLIPPPQVLHLSNLGMYEEKKEEDPNDAPKLFYVVVPANPNIYWKERTYDGYNGQGWMVQNADTRSVERNKKSDKPAIPFDIYKFLQGGAYSLDLITPFTKQSYIEKETLKLDPSAKYELTQNTYNDYTFSANIGADTSMKYRAQYYAPDFDIEKSGELKDVPKEILEVNTQLPESFPQKLKDIASGLSEKAGGDLGRQILDTYKFVQDNVEYDLKWGAGRTIPKDYDMALWTYENKKGICSHFATLFITLARAQGIPARMAVGFAGGKVKDNSVLIYSSYAHAWVEIYLPNYGWVTIDPTKGSRGEQQNQSDSENPPEWSNGGNVKPDLRFTLDDQYQKDKKKSDQGGDQNGDDNQNGNQNGDQNQNDGQSGQQGFTGDINQLPNLDQWFTDDDAQKLREEYEKWQSDQKLADGTQNSEGDIKSEESEDAELSDQGDGKEIKDNPEDKNDPYKNEDENANLASDLVKTVSSIGKNSGANILPLAFIVAFFAVAYFIYRRSSRTFAIRNELEERIEAINRFVDIAKVIEEMKALGAKGRYGAAAIYGYNELADYIAYVFELINDPALTAREFESLIKETALLQPFNIIIGTFERAKYSYTNSQEDFNNFLASLIEIAKASCLKK